MMFLKAFTCYMNWKEFKMLLTLKSHHHHHVHRSGTSMTFFFQYSLSLIAVSESSLSRLVSSVSWLIKFPAGLSLVFLPHLGSHSINLCITSLLRKQCSAKLTLCVAIVLVIFGKLSYS